MANSDSPELTTIEVVGAVTTFNGFDVKNPEEGTWNVHKTPNADIYLHNTVGIEAAMKLFVWEDLTTQSNRQVKTTSNLQGRVVGVVVRSY